MHSALEIAELIGLICAEVSVSSPQWEAKRDLNSMARACRSFSEPALDFLWKDQCGITNVLATMADDLWQIKRYRGGLLLHPLRHIRPQDWVRFDFYARRVRVFSWPDSPSPVPGTWPTVFALLAASIPVDHVFPNLKSLSWAAVKGSHSPFLHLFLSPGLETISMTKLSGDAHLSLLPSLAIYLPRLKSVTISTTTRWPQGQSEHTTMIRSLAYLERLNVPSLDQSAFTHLSELPGLTSFSIREGPHFVPVREPSDTPTFPALRQISLPNTPPAFLLVLLAMISARSLRRFHVVTYLAPTCAETTQLYALLAACSHPHEFTGLSLETQPSSVPHFGAQILDGPIPAAALRPLLQFRNLSRIRLSPSTGFDLDDAFLADLARAWPAVRSLRLGGSEDESVSYYRRPPSRVTLRGLRALAHGCPVLHTLALPFNALIVPTLAPDEPLPSPPSSLSDLVLYDTPLADPGAVAAYLGVIFPMLSDIRTAAFDEHDDADVEEEAYALDALWGQVNEIVTSSSAEGT
ncbi:hypothetical protein C8R46DRAFT_1357078 [Mycena filopes]|nr:hypothetical protein C8R46DRAFT_1357078 [Mycena filopes]